MTAYMSKAALQSTLKLFFMQVLSQFCLTSQTEFSSEAQANCDIDNTTNMTHVPSRMT